MSLKRRIDKENVVHLHNRFLLRSFFFFLMTSVGKCMELGKIILGEVTQAQKDKYGMDLLIFG